MRADGQEQAADQVSMGNTIISLRFLSSNDWRDFVEKHSPVEQILREDHIYAGMDFTTRDRYRHVVEEIARRSPISEQDAARKAITACGLRSGKCFRAHRPHVVGHVGYFLIGEGRRELELACAMRLSFWMIASRISGRYPLFVYLFAVLLITALATTAFLAGSIRLEARAIALCLLAIPFVMCAVHLAVGVVNWLAILLVHPRPLPRLDFSEGIPSEHRTMVVVPTMLSNAEAIADLLDGLEVRYLANRDENLHFALLTDLLDAPQEVMPQDAELVRLAKEGIEQLNQKYESHRSDIFYLFHRPRLWNAQEKIWMGYERKRGKLAALNGLLHEARTDKETRRRGDKRQGIRSVLTGLLVSLSPCLLVCCRRRPVCCRRCVTLSRSTRTRNCHAIRQRKWSGRWPTRSIGLFSMPSVAGSSPATASCSLALASACPVPSARGLCVCSRAMREWTPTHASFRTSTRICSAKGRSLVRASTMWTLSSNAAATSQRMRS